MIQRVWNWLTNAAIISQILTLATLIITIGIFIFQSVETRNLEKSKFLTDYTAQFITSDLHKTLVAIEYQQFNFKTLVSNSESEEKLSRMLDFLNIIAYNSEKGYIPIEELRESTMGYAIFVATNTPEIISYMQKIDERSWKHRNIPKGTAWGYLRRLGPQLTKQMQMKHSR